MKIKTTAPTNATPKTVSDQKAKQPDRLTAMLLPSVLAILLCMVCLCEMTWAWFSSTQKGEIAPIKSAEYEIVVSVKDGDTPLSVTDNTVELREGLSYTVKMVASGTASTGFCVLSYTPSGEGGNPDGVRLHTAQIASGVTFSFTLKATSDLTLTFSPQWGTSSKSDAPDILADGMLTIGN